MMTHAGIPSGHTSSRRWGGRESLCIAGPFGTELRYRNRTITVSDGTQHSFLTREEKGVDVRIAIDRDLYDQCLDQRNYHLKLAGP